MFTYEEGDFVVLVVVVVVLVVTVMLDDAELNRDNAYVSPDDGDLGETRDGLPLPERIQDDRSGVCC